MVVLSQTSAAREKFSDSQTWPASKIRSAAVAGFCGAESSSFADISWAAGCCCCRAENRSFCCNEAIRLGSLPGGIIPGALIEIFGEALNGNHSRSVFRLRSGDGYDAHSDYRCEHRHAPGWSNLLFAVLHAWDPHYQPTIRQTASGADVRGGRQRSRNSIQSNSHCLEPKVCCSAQLSAPPLRNFRNRPTLPPPVFL